MKNKFLLSALALTTTFAACTNEEVLYNEDKNVAAEKEIVGADLVSNGGGISIKGLESRVNGEGWQPADKLAMAWFNIANSIYASQDETNLGLNVNDNKIYANHLFTYNGESQKFETNSNIYQGAHFIYFPYAYSGQVADMTVNVNAAAQTTEITEDLFNKALYVSAKDFVSSENVDKETGKLAKDFYITSAVNALKVNATPEEAISGNDFLKNLEISKLDVWNEHALFNVEAKVDPHKIPAVVKDVNGTVKVADTYAALKSELAKAFTATSTTNLTTAIDADITLAQASSLRAFTLPTANPERNTATWTAFTVFVEANGEEQNYPVGKFLIELPTTTQKNVDALKKLQAALYTTPDPTVDKYYLQQNMNDRTDLAKLNLDIDLLTSDFVADYNISNLEEWNLTVAMVDAFNSLKETPVKPEFMLTGDVCVKEGETINVPAAGLSVKTDNYKVCFETDYTVDATLASVFDANDNVNVAEGATLTIVDGVKLVAAVTNNGIINVGYKAQLGNNATNSANVTNNGRINVVYGSYVYASTNGTIAYNVAAEEYAYKINNLLTKTDNVLGFAKVNTLVINEGVVFDVAKPDGDVAQQDPYDEDAKTGETIDAELLKVTDIEMNGGTIQAALGNVKEVKNVTVISGTTNNIIDMTIKGNLIVKNGAGVTVDATPYNVDGDKYTAYVDGDINNGGIVNANVTIETTDVINNEQGKSELYVAEEYIVWYTGEYKQGGLAKGNVWEKTDNTTGSGAAANVTVVNSISELQSALDAATTDINIAFGANMNGDVTIKQNKQINIVIDGKNRTYTGTMFFVYETGSNLNNADKVTIKNVNFYINSNASHDFISANVANNNTHNVIVENCNFTAEGAGDVVGMRYRSAKNMSIKNCTAKGLHSLMWATGTKNIEVEGVNMNDCKQGIHFGTMAGHSIKNSTIKTTDENGHAVRVDANETVPVSLIVENCEFEAKVPVLIRKSVSSSTSSLTLVGENTLTSTGTYQIVATATDFAGESTLTKALGTVTITGADGMKIYK